MLSDWVPTDLERQGKWGGGSGQETFYISQKNQGMFFLNVDLNIMRLKNIVILI